MASHHSCSCLYVGFSSGNVQSLVPGCLFIMDGRTVLPSGWVMSDLEYTHLYLLTMFSISRSRICHIPVSKKASIKVTSRSLIKGTSNLVSNLMGESNLWHNSHVCLNQHGSASLPRELKSLSNMSPPNPTLMRNIS